MRKSLWVTLFVGTAVLTLSGVYPLLAAEKVKIGTPLKFQAVFAMPMLAAEEKGFWKQQGLEVEWVPFTGEVPMQQAVATGVLQLAVTDVTGAISGMSWQSRHSPGHSGGPGASWGTTTAFMTA